MQQLAEVTASSASNRQKPPDDTMILDPEKPLVLSPTNTASGPYFGSEPDENGDATTNKAVSDWIAKARQSLDHFGALVGIGGGALPQRYLIRENYEGLDSSDDEEFVDVSEELDVFGNSDDRYELAVEEPNSDDMKSEGLSGRHSLLHKSSASSFGTNGTGNTQFRRRGQGDRSKPASLPVEAAPFGLFGNMSLNSRSRANSAEREDEDKRPGIANEDFFKPSERYLFCFQSCNR
jgi:hypothetical protein